MIKTIFFTTVSILLVEITFGQKIMSSTVLEKFRPIPTTDKSKLLIEIDNNQFILYSSGGKVAMFDKHLKKQYEFSLPETNYYNKIKYLDPIGRLLVLQHFKQKKSYGIMGSIYDANSGSLLKTNSIIHTSREYSGIKYSSSNSYFLLHDYFKKENKDEFIIYNSESIEKVYSTTIDLEKKDKIIFYGLSNNGLLVLCVQQKNNIIFQFFNKEGKIGEKNIEFNFSQNGYFGEYSFNELNGSGVLFFARKKDYNLVGLDYFKIDFENRLVENKHNFSIDKEVIKNQLYKSAYEPLKNDSKNNTILVPIKSRKNLKFFMLKNAFVNSDGSVSYIIEERYYSEKESGAKSYVSGDLLLIGIGEKGDKIWSSIVEKSTSNSSGVYGNQENVFKPKWTGIDSYTKKFNDEISIITWETKGSWKGPPILVLRIFNGKTGELVFAKSLQKEKDVHVNFNYLEWMGSDKIALIKMKGVSFALKKNELNLQVIQIEK